MDKYYKYYLLKEKIVSELLRSDVLLAFGLEALKYKTIFTDVVPMNAPACTDFKHIFINPDNEFYKRTIGLFESMLTFTYLHEICHNMFMHEKRGVGKDNELWNYATDFFINLFLFHLEEENSSWEAQHRLAVMEINRYSDQILFDLKFDNMIEEEIYRELQQNGSYKKQESKQSYKKFLDSVGAPNDNISDDLMIDITQSELSYDGKKFKKTTIKFPDQNSNPSQTSNTEDSDVSLSKMMFENRIKDKGFENKLFEGLIKKLFGVKVPWDTILRDSLLTDLTKKGDISYSKPRLSWLCNPTIPYLANFNDDDVLGTIVLCIDESGSISMEDLSKAIDIINQSKSYYKNIFVIKHDTISSWSKLYEGELTENDINELYIRKHSGGTSHKDAFTKIVDLSKQSDVNISIVLCITDMMSDLKETQHILPLNIPRIYIQSGEYSVDGIIGKVIKVN